MVVAEVLTDTVMGVAALPLLEAEVGVQVGVQVVMDIQISHSDPTVALADLLAIPVVVLVAPGVAQVAAVAAVLAEEAEVAAYSQVQVAEMAALPAMLVVTVRLKASALVEEAGERPAVLLHMLVVLVLLVQVVKQYH